MEDSSASIMTIEFLRARLLAERSVSKAARQRADELQNRLGQLQDQLNFISLQRKNTENATSQLLSRLSDEDAFHSDLTSSTTEEEEEEEEEAEAEEELDHHPSVLLTKPPSSLSWKPSSKDTTRTNSIQKRHSSRQTSFSSIRSSSPKHPSAKSCRKIGRRETRSSKDEFNAVKDENMETALERQAQLIGRYQEEEKAQRDWEHKFRETNTSTQDTNEPENQSDITEEIYDTKVGCGAPIVSENQNVASGAIKVSFYQPEYACAESKLEQRGSDFLDYESVPSEKGIAKEKQAQKQSEIYSHHPSSHDHPRGKGKLDSLLKPSASFMSSSIHGGSRSFSLRSENERNRIVVHKPAVEIVGVLEALEAAKSSIERRLGRLPPLLEGGSSSSFSSSRVDMPPVGCAGLFRIPSDTKSKLQDSSAGLNLTTSHPADNGNVQTTGGLMKVVPSLPPHMGIRSNVLSSSEGFVGSPYRERVWKENANGYTENYPRYPGFPDLKGGMQSSNEGIVRTLRSPPEQFTFYGGGVRPNNNVYI